MSPLPGQRPTVTAGQPDLNYQAHQLLVAVEDALQAPTSYRSTDSAVPSWADGPQIGTAPAVPQPGVPPMSQRSTDIGRTALYCGVATVPPGLIAIGVMLASTNANTTVIGCICVVPAALAVPILAVTRLLRGAKEVVAAAPAEVHHHYSGPVHQDQRNVHTRTSGLWAKTHNRQ